MRIRKAGKTWSEAIAFLSAAICAAFAPTPSSAETINGDHTISADTTLTEDLTVTGTLTFENGATIDLQGHKLTAAGFANNSPNLIANGSFENYTDNTDQTAHPDHHYGYRPTVYYAFFHTYDSICEAGPLALSDWDCTMASGETGAGLAQNNIINTTVPDGKNVLFYLGKRTISQAVNIPANGLYSLSYYYGARGNTSSGGHVQIDIGAKTGLAPVHCTSKTASLASCLVELPEGEQTFKIRGTGGGSGNASHHWVDGVVLKQVATITDTSTANLGELHITDGAETLNGEISVNGNLKVILHEQTINGDLTASVDMTLTGDVTVNGTIAMDQSATLDLNGNELTAQGVEAGYETYKNGDLTKSASDGGTIISDCTLYDSSYKVAVAFNDNFTVKGDATHRVLYNLTQNGPFWVTYDFGEGTRRKVAKYKVWFGQNAGGSYAGRAPKTWVFEGSNDNVNWNPVDSRSNETSWTCPSSGTAVAREYTCSHPGAYRYYRWTCTAHNGKDNYLEFVQLEYFGSAAITDTSTDAANRGELRLAVPQGTTLANDKIVISGNLDFVKAGAGTFTCATEGLMTYLGDTYIDGGTYVCGLAGSKHPFGGGNVVVNGNFDAEPLSPDGNTFVSIASSGYKYRVSSGSVQFLWKGWLDEGSGAGLARPGSTFVSDTSVGNYAAFIHTYNGAASQGRNIYQDLFLAAGKYKWSFRYAKRPGYGSLNSYATYNFNFIQNSTSTAITLESLKLTSDTFQEAFGTVNVSEAGSYRLQFIATNYGNFGAAFDDVVLERIPDVYVAAGATLDLNGKSGFGNYKFVLDGGTLRNSGADVAEETAQLANIVLTADSVIDVQGNMGMVASSGATTIDLGGHTLAVSIASGKNFYFADTDVTAGTLDISGDGTVKVGTAGLHVSAGTLNLASALNGTVTIDPGALTADRTRIPLLRAGSAEMLPAESAIVVVGGVPRSWGLVVTEDGLGYDLKKDSGLIFIIR